MATGRVDLGYLGQEDIKQFIIQNKRSVISTALRASQAPDLIFNDNGVKVQCEIKQTNRFLEVTVFDEVIERGVFAKKMPNNLIFNIKENLFDDRSRVRGSEFEEYIDYLRRTKGISQAGFKGDSGSIPNSGRLKVEDFKFTNDQTINSALVAIRNHWKEDGDDFFILVDTNTKDAVFFSTSGKTKKFIDEIAAPPLQKKHLSYIRFDSAGSAYKNGQIRVAIKLGINSNALVKTSIKKI